MRSFLVILVVAWVALVTLSFVLSGQIEGPRTLDTGLQRLDVFFKWQVVALVVAFAAMIVAWRERTLSRGLRVLGFGPLAITLLVVGGIALFAALYEPPMPEPAGPRTPTAPAAPATSG